MQDTDPSKAIEQFMMGAVNTRGDAEMAHLMVVLWGGGGGGWLSIGDLTFGKHAYMLNSVLNSSSVMFCGRSLALAHWPLQPDSCS